MENYKTKDITSPDQDEKVTIRAVSQIKNEYHFPGSGKWKPMAVIATNIDEAMDIWKQRRIPANPEEKVVEGKTETNNE
jgi:hypothetical protein